MNMNSSPKIYSLAAGHLLVDFNQGALAALLPFFIADKGISYAVAASLVLYMNLVSSVVQPLFGVISDKKPNLWILPISLLLASGGLCYLSFADDYLHQVIGVMISGIGIAAYHPDSSKMVNSITTSNLGKNMSIFSVGGNLGFGVSPIIITALVSTLGFKGISLLLLPTLLVIGIIMKKIIFDKESVRENVINTAKGKEFNNDWKSFSILSVVLLGRSIVFYGLNTFLAVYLISELGQTKVMGNIALTMFFISGALGTLIGGRVADRIGFTKIINISFAIMPILILILALSNNAIFSIIMLIPIGISLFATYSPIVILGQKFLPKFKGFASGVTLGLSMSIGGLVTPVLGKIGDVFNLQVVILILAGVTLIGLIFSFMIKDKQLKIVNK
jgi:FSR family fosmidomycin resistance protein-like MFS transporter